ncbi:MAG: hypothetical protein IJS60_05655 [Abditibacteriota bacterium]|nr:hypothetical protein [Abditibacteriota bacterium]
MKKIFFITVLFFISTFLWAEVLYEDVVINKDEKNEIINMIYPKFLGKDASLYNMAVEAKVSNIEANFHKLVAQYKLKHVVSLDLYSHITCNDDRILSGVINAYKYTGGKHAQSSLEVFNFVDGNYVSFEDLFADMGGIKTLVFNKVNEEKARRGFTDNSVIFFDSYMRNFVLEGGLITWAFDPEVVGKIGEGSYIISLTYDEVKPYLKEHTPIDFLIKEPLKRVPCEFYLQVDEELPENFETRVKLFDGDTLVAEVKGQKLRFSYGGDFSEDPSKVYTIVPEILFAGEVAYKAKEKLQIDKEGFYHKTVEMEKVPGEYNIFKGFNGMGGDFSIYNIPVYLIYDEKGGLWHKFIKNTGYAVYYYNLCGPKDSKMQIEAFRDNKKIIQSQKFSPGEEPIFEKTEVKK